MQWGEESEWGKGLSAEGVEKQRDVFQLASSSSANELNRRLERVAWLHSSSVDLIVFTLAGAGATSKGLIADDDERRRCGDKICGGRIKIHLAYN